MRRLRIIRHPSDHTLWTATVSDGRRHGWRLIPLLDARGPGEIYARLVRPGDLSGWKAWAITVDVIVKVDELLKLLANLQ